MTGFENHAGFTISATKLQVVEISSLKNQFFLDNVDEAYFNEPLNFEKDKETRISALLQSAFNELIIRKHIKSKSVSFTLPFELFYFAQLPYDNTLLHQDLVEEFRWELSILYPYMPAKNLVIQYIEIDKNKIIPNNTAMVVGLQRKYLQILNNFCRQNNLRLKFVDNVHFAAERALAVSGENAAAGLSMSVHISNRHLSILFLLNSKPIQFSLRLMNDASEIPENIIQALTPRDSFNINKNLLSTAYITGDDLTNSVVQTLSDTLGINFIQFNPFEKINPEQNLVGNKFYSENFNSFAPAAGIAYRVA
jgi:Tfp pilus assembly PilM family ATPase